MKPVKITIKAFICYADEQVIDFTKLGENGLYLITGQTGAGKTTIFDAISYALYGEASGNARNKPEKLRSQFVENSEKTVVDFDFISNGKIYNIRREIRPQISRETKEIAKLNESVVLRLADGTLIDRDREVTAKIEEIIGLDKDQFAQIVMIAQNDFLRFLQSGTEKRVNILRRIFNTGHIKNFQERLKNEKKNAEYKVELIKRDFVSRNVDPYEWERICVEIKEWLIDAGKQQKEIAESTKAQSKGEKELAAEIALAESVAKSFQSLSVARNANIKQAEQKDNMDTLRIRKARGEIALFKVKPIADKCYKAKEENTAASRGLAEADEKAKAAEIGLKEATELLETLPSVVNAEETYSSLEKKYLLSKEKLEKLTVLKGQYDSFIEKEKLLTATQLEAERLQTAFNDADNEYKALYDRFIRSQAGLLARDLKDGVPCVVCGSTIHPAPAMLTDDNVNEGTLNRLQKDTDYARVRLNKTAQDCAGLKSEIQTLRDSFEREATKVIADFDFNSVAEKLNIERQTLYKETDALQKESEEKKTALNKLKFDFTAATKKQSESSVASAAALTLVEERTKRASATQEALNAAISEFEATLRENKFQDEQDYRSAILTEADIADITKTINEYDENCKQIKRDILRLEAETKGKELPDMEVLRIKAKEFEDKLKELRDKDKELSSKIGEQSSLIEKLTDSAKELDLAEKKLIAIKGLSDAANGKLDFETYAQIAYFERVLKAANLRLRTMSQNRYALLRKSEEGDRRQRMGLEIDVFDVHTGKPRSVDSLSGGESFLASLSLALGLSDVVQQSAGSVHIDAMFIDEGFGSLDMDVLDLSIKTLSDMAGNNRIIGIISHVSELRERIDKRIDVEKTPVGSRIALSL